MSGGFSARGKWAIQFPPPDKTKFFAAVRGTCWCRFDDNGGHYHLNAGDVVVIAASRGFVMGSHEHVPARDGHTVFDGRLGAIVHVGDGHAEDTDALFIGGHIRLDATLGALLTDVLPACMHVDGSQPEARAVRWVLDQLVSEHEALPGSGLAMSQLAHLLFVQVLRAHLAAGGELPPGWLRAATDPRLAAALRCMHGAPGYPWRLQDLAARCAMSRTRFAEHFRNTAGQSPLAYLTRWRMHLAEHALREGDVPVASLAQRLGYASESAFSHAFKRITGLSPQRYGQRMRPATGQRTSATHAETSTEGVSAGQASASSGHR